MGAYLAARKWLQAGNDPMKSFLHVGIYAKASLKPNRLVSFASKSKKSPDFLVEADSGDWHVFESKGGVASERFARICEGLKQLDGLPSIGWTGFTPTPARTAVCVHTSIDNGMPLAFMAVDPPSDIKASDEGFVLVKSAARAFQIVEAVEQFKALTVEASTQGTGTGGWTIAPISAPMEVKIGIPNRYLRAEKPLLRALAVFLAVREFLEKERPSSRSGTFTERLRQSVRLKLASNSDDVDSLRISRGWLDRKLKRLPRSKIEGFFLAECARVLEFDRLLKYVESNIGERVQFTLEQGTETVFTSSGLLLLGAAAGPSTEEVVQNVASRG
ncbi:hypothetical protein [Caballeronia sp. S22]|uniref:hypothetical protein n=1 Tax=Caballeronia sp. S22 TaxID=3137182 RepID=UPI00353143D9